MKQLYSSTLFALSMAGVLQASEASDIKKLKAQGSPLVLRCVLDKEPRVLALQLDDDRNIAYSTWRCHLLKIWKGTEGKNIELTGAVFDGKHGPQPTLVGEVLLSQNSVYWSHSSGAKLTYIGHRIKDQVASVVYGFINSSGVQLVTIEESPSYKKGTFTRSIKVTQHKPGTLIFSPQENSPWEIQGKAVKQLRLSKSTSFKLTTAL